MAYYGEYRDEIDREIELNEAEYERGRPAAAAGEQALRSREQSWINSCRPQIAVLLRQAGYDVDAVADREDLVGRSDLIILEVACSEGRAVVTNNIKDFRPLAAEWLAQGRVQAGLILLPSTRTRSRNAIAAVAAAIERVLRDHPDGVSGSERWFAPLPKV